MMCFALSSTYFLASFAFDQLCRVIDRQARLTIIRNYSLPYCFGTMLYIAMLIANVHKNWRWFINTRRHKFDILLSFVVFVKPWQPPLSTTLAVVLMSAQLAFQLDTITMADTDEQEVKNPTTDNSDWILDSLVMYLRGPLWTIPILNFIEQKSVGKLNSFCLFQVGHCTWFDSTVFEGQGDHEDEYRLIHDKFRNLVTVYSDCILTVDLNNGLV